MSVSADSTPSPRIMKPSATRVPREPESSTPKTPGKFNDMNLVVRKPVFGVSDQVRHKPGCTATEDGWRLEISDLGSRGIVLSV